MAIGNRSARARLEAELRAPGHAYLLTGRAGWGVAVAAREFAAALAGIDPKRISAGHPDVLEVRAEGTQIRMEQVRELWRDIQMRPFSAERRVYLLWDAETMPELVQHALLKSIEEPPAHAVIVLVCAQPNRLLATVRSRCTLIPFGPLTSAEIAGELEIDQQTARAAAGDLERARELAQGGDARDRRARYLALARASYRDDAFDPAAAARAVADAAAGRAAELRTAVEAETEQLLAQLGDRPPRGEASRVRKAGEALAKRRARAAEVDETRAAVDLIALWFRDLLAVAVGAPDALLCADHASELGEDGAGREQLASRALAAARETRRALDLTITPALASEALFHRLRALARSTGSLSPRAAG